MVTFREVKPSDIPKGAGTFAVNDTGKVTFQPHRAPAKYKRYPFQVHDLGILKEDTITDGGSANWSEMGCFKTTTGLWLGEDLRCKKILIITTKTGKVTFFQTVPYVLPDHKLVNVESTSKMAHVPEYAVVLAHFNLFQNRSKVRELIAEEDWDLVIIDEAHRIKNRNAQWTKNVKKIKSTYRHIMTGTGFINKPDEIWSLLNYLYPKQFKSYWSFRRRYCTEQTGMGPNGQYSTVTGLKPEMIEQFQAIVYGAGVRRTKVELFDELPHLMPPTKVWVSLNSTQRKMYDQMKQQLYMLDQEGYPIMAPQVLSMLTRLRQVCVATPHVLSENYDAKVDRLLLRISLVEPSSKLDALIELLEGTDTPSVVFTQFATMGQLTADRFRRAGLELGKDYIHMEAKDADDIRQSKVAKFQDGRVRVFLSTIALGSESITLTAADKVIFLDRSWSPAHNNQAIARVHRPGQTRPVQPIYIEAVDTVDQYVESRLKEKEHWFNMIFGQGNETVSTTN